MEPPRSGLLENEFELAAARLCWLFAHGRNCKMNGYNN